MNRVKVACAALLASAALPTLQPAHADHIKVFLLAGQSNMDGRAPASGLPTNPVNLQLPQADILFYEGGNLRTLRPDSGTDFGPEITFGRSIADEMAGDAFGLIKYGVGGTDLHNDWDPATGGTYNTFRNIVTNGLNALAGAGHTYEIVGMLWTQGERDAKTNRTTAQYEFDLNEFIADIRTNYGADLPFLLSRLSSGQTNINPTQLSSIRTAQQNVADNDPLAFMIDTDGFGIKGDNLHFNAAGQIALGEAFAQTFIDPDGSGDPDPDPTLTTFFDFNSSGSNPPSDWVAVNAATSGNGGQITQTDTATGIAVTLNVGNGQTDLLGRTRTLDKADPAVTLGDMFEDFVIRVGDIEVSGLTPNGE
ncbi:MAG: sialate O-acetylesterase, partial [Phycisphaeraceae bacterium]